MKDELKDEKEEKVLNKDFMTIHHDKGICLSGSLVYHHYLEHSRQEWNLITGIHENMFPKRGREERERKYDRKRERDKLSLKERNDENYELETKDAKSGSSVRSSR